MTRDVLYGADLARVHDEGFGDYARDAVPVLLELLEPVRAAGGTVLELGAGSGALTRELVEAGLRVVATDASPAMLALLRTSVPGALEHRLLVLPDGPLPTVDAIVSVGHVLNYLPSEAEIRRALAACVVALRPGGLLALDLCDLRYGEARRDAPPAVRTGLDWLIACRFARPDPRTFVREITTFVAAEQDRWRRTDEVHRNVLVDVSEMAELLAERGLAVSVRAGFVAQPAAEGLMAIVARAEAQDVGR